MDGANTPHRLPSERHGAQARAILNLVVPLASPATAMHTTETTRNTGAGPVQFPG